MSDARPFFTVPGGVWRRDPVLNGCREDSIIVFNIVALASDRDWRVEVSPSNHAFSVRQLILDPERFRRWSEERIHRALGELRARGCLLLATANDREWLEVPDRLCYAKGHKAQAPLKPMEQVPFPEPSAAAGEPQLFALPPPQWNERREKKIPLIDSEKIKPTEQTTPAPESVLKGSLSFAVAVSDLNKMPLGVRLGQFLGAAQWLKESQTSGREWLRILREEPAELSDVLEQAERTRAEIPAGSTRAKFITKRLGERRQRDVTSIHGKAAAAC